MMNKGIYKKVMKRLVNRAYKMNAVCGLFTSPRKDSSVRVKWNLANISNENITVARKLSKELPSAYATSNKSFKSQRGGKC